MSKPYVVSTDIYLLLQQWAARRGFTLPPAKFFVKLRRKFAKFFTGIFPMFEMIPEQEIVDGIRKFADYDRDSRFVISLERAYFGKADFTLDICRWVEGVSEHVPRMITSVFGGDSFVHRPATPETHEQLNHLRRAFKAFDKKVRRRYRNQIKAHAVLVDDSLYTGRMLYDLVQAIKADVPIEEVVVGSEVEHVFVHAAPPLIHDHDYGARFFERETGIIVRAVRRYNEVIDQICERDFYPGVPFSGRAHTPRVDVQSPYVRPFGDPVMWASIPVEWYQRMSTFCLQQSVELFLAIENASGGRLVFTKDLDNRIFLVPSIEEDPHLRWVTVLQGAIDTVNFRNTPEAELLYRPHRGGGLIDGHG